MEEFADEDIEWVENLVDIKFTLDSAMEVILDQPKTAKVPQPVLPQNADANTVKTFFPNQAIAQPLAKDNNSSDSSANNGTGQASPTPEAQSASASSDEVSVMGA